MPRKVPVNTLNDLDGKDWVKATKSWFVINPRPRTEKELQHPAKFPEELVRRLVSFFTKNGQWVLDPFAGVGSTLLACKKLERNSVGIELNDEFANAARRALGCIAGGVAAEMLIGDSRESSRFIAAHFGRDVPRFNYVLTSPPYYDMLSKSRGGNDSTHKMRAESGLKETYSDSEFDLGNLEDYHEYLDAVVGIIAGLKPLLAEGAYLTVIAQNMRDIDGVLRPIAWDLAKGLGEYYTLRQEMIWCQDNKRLGCWGYPTTYVSNVHHHHCIILQSS
jgi:hypothetical protein